MVFSGAVTGWGLSITKENKEFVGMMQQFSILTVV